MTSPGVGGPRPRPAAAARPRAAAGPTSGPSGTRRPPRRAASRNRFLVRRLAVLAVFGLVVYGGARIVGTITDTRASRQPITTAGTATATTTSLAASGAAAANAPAAPPTTAGASGPPSGDNPARILIVGDSDAGTFGPYLEQLVDEDDDVAAIVDVKLDYVVSSGLARPDFHDWPAYLQSALTEYDPDVVIVTFGGNDAQGLSEPCPNGQGTCGPQWVVGHPVENAEEWSAEYQRRVGAVLDLILAGGRQVIWVGIPNAASPTMTAGLELQDQAVRAALEGRQNVSFIDTWDRFDGRNGGYAEYVPDPRDGAAKPIRAADGFHLNTTGAEILALDIFAELESVLRGLGAEI